MRKAVSCRRDRSCWPPGAFVVVNHGGSHPRPVGRRRLHSRERPLMALARIQLGKAFSVAPKATTLVTHGLYSKIPHPLFVFLDPRPARIRDRVAPDVARGPVAGTRRGPCVGGAAGSAASSRARSATRTGSTARGPGGEGGAARA